MAEGFVNDRTHLQSVSDVLKEYGVEPTDGLTSKEVKTRQQTGGPNSIPRARKDTPLRLILDRFKDVLVIILLIAAGLSLATGHIGDAIIIGLTILLDSTLTFIQLWRTEKTLQSLRQHVKINTTVVRGGEEHIAAAQSLVVGDIIKITAGDKVPADARLVSVTGLTVNESPLTGESKDITKSHTKLSGQVPVASRTNMIFFGTTVTSGSAIAIVTAIGTRTEIGKIAQVLKTSQAPPSPLRVKLQRAGLKIGWGIIGAVSLIAVASIATGATVAEAARTTITLVVSAIPEDLTIILTIALTLGLRRLLRHQGLVRELASAETLGGATVICTDKTGTLTTGVMQGVMFDFLQGDSINEDHPPHRPIHTTALLGLVLNTDAHRVDGRSVGDSTEQAAGNFGTHFGISPDRAHNSWKPLATLPFNSRLKFRASLNQHPQSSDHVMFVTGAPGVLLSRANRTLNEDGEAIPLTPNRTQELQAAISAHAASGNRLLAVAYRPQNQGSELTAKGVNNLIFLGVLLINDPIRPEVPTAIQETLSAGIQLKMITGDHPSTARAIARAAGLPATADTVITGTELTQLSDEELGDQIESITIFARVTPLDKLRIIRALRNRGHVVAMTGDGVNDAVALKTADIGVAMGSGKDIAKEAAKLVLLDDNFATIVAAIREGRIMRSNLRKVIAFLLSTNTAEVAMFFGAVLMRLPLPLLPAQILWVNIVTDGTSDLALAMEPGEKSIMQRPPESPSNPLLSRRLLAIHVLVPGLIITTAILILYNYVLPQGSLQYARTMVFAFLSLVSLASVWSFRSLTTSLYRRSLWDNRWIILSAGASLALQLVAIYHPAFQKFFDAVPLSSSDWVLIGFLALITVLVIDARKLVFKTPYEVKSYEKPQTAAGLAR